jgi:hypothetical protein
VLSLCSLTAAAALPVLSLCSHPTLALLSHCALTLLSLCSLTLLSLCFHPALTALSLCSHPGITLHSLCSHCALTLLSMCSHPALTLLSPRSRCTCFHPALTPLLMYLLSPFCALTSNHALTLLLSLCYSHHALIVFKLCPHCAFNVLSLCSDPAMDSESTKTLLRPRRPASRPRMLLRAEGGAPGSPRPGVGWRPES